MAQERKSALVLDFDGTIFNTSEMDRVFLRVAYEHGIPEYHFKDAYGDAKREFGSNDLSNHVYCMAKRVADEFGAETLSARILADLLRNLDVIAPSLVFLDAEKLIEAAVSASADIDTFILSRGNYFFQMRKITATGLAGKFTGIHISRKYKAMFLDEIAGAYRRICFCDNTKAEVEGVTDYVCVGMAIKNFSSKPVKLGADVPMRIVYLDRNNTDREYPEIEQGEDVKLGIKRATSLDGSIIDWLRSST